MVSEQLLKILVCPETKQPVSLASSEVLTTINERIQLGKLSNLAGAVVKEPVDGVLVRSDGKRAYLVRDDIPIMLVDEAVSLEN